MATKQLVFRERDSSLRKRFAASLTLCVTWGCKYSPDGETFQRLSIRTVAFSTAGLSFPTVSPREVCRILKNGQGEQMPPSRRIVLYGNSIALAGIAVNCANQPGLEIVSIDVQDPEARQRLQELAADVIIFDLAAQPSDAITLFKSHSHLVLVGVDQASGQVLVLSGQHAAALSAKDLINLVNKQEQILS